MIADSEEEESNYCINDSVKMDLDGDVDYRIENW